MPASVPSSVSLTPMAPEMALFHLGDLLIHVTPDRAADAEAHFRASLDLSPTLHPPSPVSVW